MTMPLAVEYQRAARRKLSVWFGGIVRRGTATAASGATVTVSTYDGDGMGTIARLRGPAITAGDTVYLLNVTGDPDHPGWLVLGAEGAPVVTADVYANTWTSGTEPSTTNSSTPVSALHADWALPAGTYTVVVTGFAGMRNNVDSGYKGYLAVQINGTIVGSVSIAITTSAGAQPIVRAPVSIGGSAGGLSGTVGLDLMFRNDTGTGVTCWCYCPTLIARARRTS